MNFYEHGVYSIKIIERTLFIDATGPFNGEFVEEYNNAIHKCVISLAGADWTQIVVLHGLSLLTPEAESKLDESLLDRKNNGLTRAAIVCDSDEGKTLIFQQLSRCYKKVGIQHNCFTNLTEAKHWLTKKSE